MRASQYQYARERYQRPVVYPPVLLTIPRPYPWYYTSLQVGRKATIKRAPVGVQGWQASSTNDLLYSSISDRRVRLCHALSDGEHEKKQYNHIDRHADYILFATWALSMHLHLRAFRTGLCHGIPFPLYCWGGVIPRGRGIIARSLRAHLSGAFWANNNTNTFVSERVTL